MITVGLKVGPASWEHTLKLVKPPFVEIWFRLDWYKKYQPLFNYLQKNQIKFGLHYWATIDNHYFPCLLYLGKDIAKKTFQTICQTIDIASSVKASYVNFHPESYRLCALDLDKSTIAVVNENEPIDREKSFNQLLDYLKKINQYANLRCVTAFIETVPKYTPADFGNMQAGRMKIQKSEGLETENFFEIAKLGYPICFDIGHTLGQIITEDKTKLYNYVLQAAKKMCSTIGLIHITTNLSPFNGVDSHNGILPEDFAKGVVPSKQQLIEILSLFKEKEVILIPEPQIDKMIANYFALQKIVADL